MKLTFIKKHLFLPILLVSLLITATSFSQNKWTKKADFAGVGRYFPISFSIGNKGYVGTGQSHNGQTSDFWEYNPATDAWVKKADFGGGHTIQAVGFSIGLKGYVIPGSSNQLWEYDPSTDVWTRKANFGGPGQYNAVGFAIGNKGYVGAIGSNYKSPEFWEYDPAQDSWTRKADYGGGIATFAVGFSIGSKGYMGTGTEQIDTSGTQVPGNDFWEYDPATDKWTRKALVGGGARQYASAFSIGTKGYIGTGNSASQDFWEYDPATDFWTQVANIGGAGTTTATGFSVGNKGYVACGQDGTGYSKALWEFSLLPFTISFVNVSCNGGTDGSASINITGTATPYSYLWSNGATTQNISGLGVGTYSVTVTDINGNAFTDKVTISNTVITLGVTPVCMVTTDSAGMYNRICWDKSAYNNVDSIIVYRQDIISSNYLRIGAVGKNALSEFTDTVFSIGGPNGGNPKYASWLYKLAAKDICGNVGKLSPYHQSMFVQKNGSNFSWNAYNVESGQANPITGYSLLRDNNNTGNWQVLVNTAGTSATDPNYANYPNANWRVNAVGFNCTLSNSQTYVKSLSNTTKPTLTGLQHLASAAEQISVYPNPAHGVFYLQLNSYEKAQVKIFNTYLECIYQNISSSVNEQIDLSSQPNGIYFLQLKTEHGTATKKLIINR